jgi:uncharacterized protein (DUF58 family)
MLPTPRLLLLLLIGAPFIAAGVVARPLSGLALAYLLVIAGITLSDLLFSHRPRQIEVERIHDQRLSLGAANLITIIVANAGERPLRFTIRDEYPHEIAADNNYLSGVAEPYNVAEMRYHLYPLRRGDYNFGDIVMRYRGVLGMIERQVRYPAAGTIRVYPNVLEMRKYDLLARKGLLTEIGLRPARVYGQGGEFERLRDYTTDDEYRRIDWKATARRGKPIAADFETERSQHVLCAIDTGRLLAAPVGDPALGIGAGLSRLDYVINTALLLSYVAALKGDQIGMLTFADQIGTYLAPHRGKAQFQTMLETLYNLQTQQVEADYAGALGYLSHKQRRRSLVILFTDLVTAEASRPLVAHLSRLARRHLPICVMISDPNVASTAYYPADDSRALYRRAVAEKLLDERQVILDTLQRSGVITIDVPADRLTVAVINTYLRLKAQARL